MMAITTSNSTKEKPRPLVRAMVDALRNRAPGCENLAPFRSASVRTSRIRSSRDAKWLRGDECSKPTVGPSSSRGCHRRLLRARITGASVRSGSAPRTRPGYSRRDLVILFQSLGLGGARTGDCSLRLGRLFLDGRLVVLPATSQPQEAKAQQSKAQPTGEHPHGQPWENNGSGRDDPRSRGSLPACGAGPPNPIRFWGPLFNVTRAAPERQGSAHHRRQSAGPKRAGRKNPRDVSGLRPRDSVDRVNLPEASEAFSRSSRPIEHERDSGGPRGQQSVRAAADQRRATASLGRQPVQAGGGSKSRPLPLRAERGGDQPLEGQVKAPVAAVCDGPPSPRRTPSCQGLSGRTQSGIDN
jgi:hypothetical protein